MHRVDARLCASRPDEVLRCSRNCPSSAPTDYLSHFNDSGIGAEWLLDQGGVLRSIIGQNIGHTTDPSGYSAMDVLSMLHDAFMRSDKHRENVLDGRFQQIGIGMANANGKYYIAVVFSD